MSRKFDSRTTTFSPEGRLYQVEYATEAVSRAGSAIGILSPKEGIILASEKKLPSKLLEESKTSEKMYKLDNHVGCVVAGITSDANILINKLRVYAQDYLYTYNEPIHVEKLVRQLCDLKQSYTQFGGLRPFGAAFLYAGYDELHGFQLYQSEPSGNYSGWKAAAIGANSQAAQSILKADYTEDITLKQACGLALKILAKTIDSNVLTSDKVDVAVLAMSGGEPTFKVFGKEEITALIKEHEEEISMKDDEKE